MARRRKREPLPKRIYATWDELPELYRMRYMQAGPECPEMLHDFTSPAYDEIVGIYQLVDFVVVKAKPRAVDEGLERLLRLDGKLGRKGQKHESTKRPAR